MHKTDYAQDIRHVVQKVQVWWHLREYGAISGDWNSSLASSSLVYIPLPYHDSRTCLKRHIRFCNERKALWATYSRVSLFERFQ